MSDSETLDERLRAVERALTGTDHEVAGLSDAAALATRIEDLETRLDEIAERQRDLEASTQAVRGYVGNVRAVNRDVEQRADAALAKIEELERRLDERERSDESDNTTLSASSAEPQRDASVGPAQSAESTATEPHWTAGSTPTHTARSETGDQRGDTPTARAGRTDSGDEDGDERGFLSALTSGL